METSGNFDPTEKQESDFERMFAANCDELLLIFEDEHDGDKAFIDVQVELKFPNLRDFTDSVASSACYEEPSEEAKAVAYRAFHMACTTTRILTQKDDLLFSFRKFMCSDNADSINQELNEFALGHPSVVKVIDHLAGLVDPTGEFRNVALGTAITTFMLIEEGEQLRSELAANKATTGEQETKLESEEAVREQFKLYNEQLTAMLDGPERDEFGDQAMVRLNEAWSELEFTGSFCEMEGLATLALVNMYRDEEGAFKIEYEIVRNTKAMIEGITMGFVYMSSDDTSPKQLWYKQDLIAEQAEYHPLIPLTAEPFALFSDDVVIYFQSEGQDIDREFAHGGYPEPDKALSKEEAEAFSSIEEHLDPTEYFDRGAAAILSARSDALARRLKSHKFHRRSHQDQIKIVDTYISETIDQADIIDTYTEMNPQYGYVMREVEGVMKPIAIGFNGIALSGTVKAITMLGREVLQQRRIVNAKDLLIPSEGLFVSVEVQEAYLMANERIKPSEIVHVPITGQDFLATFAYIDEPVVD